MSEPYRPELWTTVKILDERLIAEQSIYGLIVCKVIHVGRPGFMFSVRNGYSPKKYNLYAHPEHGGSPVQNGSVVADEAECERLGGIKLQEILAEDEQRLAEARRQ